jgi:hypothetical protein
MEIRGRVISLSNGVAKVCIVKENTTCGECSACPAKMGIRDVVSAEAVKGVLVGDVVVLKDNRSWFVKNNIMLVIAAFVLGVMITEAISAAASFNAYRKEIDLLGGCIAAIIEAIIARFLKPKYYFRIELIKGEKG